MKMGDWIEAKQIERCPLRQTRYKLFLLIYTIFLYFELEMECDEDAVCLPQM